MSDSDSKESLSNVSDSSFIILGLGSLPNQSNNESLKENSNSNLPDSSKCSGTYSKVVKSSSDENKSLSDCSFFEGSIQGKLNELVKENYQLKETLNQNNLAIKSQLDTFFMWQQEVLKTHETHKQKFQETKDLILKLRMENVSLKKQLMDFSNEFSVISAIDSSAQVNKIAENANKIENNIKEFENMNSELPGDNNDSIKNLKLVEDLENAKKEILKLKENLGEIGTENILLKEKIENLQKNSDESTLHKSLPNAEARAQISNLFKQLEEEKGKVLKLKEVLKKTDNASPDRFNLKIIDTDELSHCIDKLDDMNYSLDEQNKRLSGFNSWVTLAEEKLKGNLTNEKSESNLMCEIKEFKSHLNLKENVFKEKQESVVALKKQYIKLLEDYKILQEQLNLLSNKGQDIEKFQKKIGNLSADFEVEDTQLLAKQQECDILKEEIKKLNSDWAEKVAILEIQVDLYKTDFNCEREAREKLAGEKEQMAEQIRLLQSQINDFEKLTSKGNDFHKSSPLESAGKKTTYMCPKCMFSFYSLEKCEKHIDQCLNIHMYP